MKKTYDERMTDERIVKAIFGERHPIWNAYEQGQFARATDQPKSSNYWRHFPRLCARKR